MSRTGQELKTCSLLNEQVLVKNEQVDKNFCKNEQVDKNLCENEQADKNFLKNEQVDKNFRQKMICLIKIFL